MWTLKIEDRKYTRLAQGDDPTGWMCCIHMVKTDEEREECFTDAYWVDDTYGDFNSDFPSGAWNGMSYCDNHAHELAEVSEETWAVQILLQENARLREKLGTSSHEPVGLKHTQYCIMSPNEPNDPHRGPWTKEECDEWLDDGETPWRKLFYVAQREVSEWTKVDE